MSTITQTTMMQRPKPPPPPPPGVKPPPPPPPPNTSSKPAAVIEPCHDIPEQVGDKRPRTHSEPEMRKHFKSNTSLSESDTSNSLWVPSNLRDVNAFQKKHQVGQGTYGYVKNSVLIIIFVLGWRD